MSIARGSRQILIHGMVMILAGFLWGLVVPHTPYPRLALGAHIQFETNGLLFIVTAALLLTIPHGVGRKSVMVMLLAAWLIWAMALSEVGNAWWGTTQMLPLAAHQAAALGGRPWQERVVMLTHIAAGIALIVGWSMLIVGFIRKASPRD